MEAIEFSVLNNKKNQIEIPKKFQKILKPNAPLRVIILIEENKDESDWKQLATQQFLNGYSEKDSIYDTL